MKNPRDLPGGPQVSGHASDLSVGGHPAPGNAVDGFDHPDGEGLVRHELGSRWYLMLMVIVRTCLKPGAWNPCESHAPA